MTIYENYILTLQTENENIMPIYDVMKFVETMLVVPYKQRVGGSNPSAPTVKIKALQIICEALIFLLM